MKFRILGFIGCCLAVIALVMLYAQTYVPGSVPQELAFAGQIVAGLLVFAIAAVCYFLPTIIAMARHQPNRMAIGALNLFLGWSLIGWVIALVWSFTVSPDRQQT